MSALELLAEALARSRAATTAERLPASARRVGELFMRGADVPDTFERGRSFADSAGGLADQFGVDPQRLRPLSTAINPDDSGALYGYSIAANPGQGGADVPRLLGSAHTKFNLLNPKLTTPSVMDALVSGLIGDRQISHLWDTSNLGITSGEGSRLYPAAFGALASLGPDNINLSLALSGPNQLRRSYHQAAALERDPGLARQILVNPAQLRSKFFDYQIPLSTGEFHRMSPEEQVGVLQLTASQGALTSLRDALRRDAERLASPIGEAPMKLAQRKRAQDMINMAAPMFFRDTGGVGSELLARGYHQSPSSASFPFGARSLRKLGVVDEALKGASFEDLADRFPGLEYAVGGRV